MRQDEKYSKRTLAILAAIVAGACWGVSFLAPRALSENSAAEIALFRFLFFGLSSAFALFLRRGKRPVVSFRSFGAALVLSLSGYSFYYTLLAYGVKGAGITFGTAIIGLLPLTIMLAATPFRQWMGLKAPVVLIGLGGILLPLELFGRGYADLLARTPLERGLGLAATISALALWTLFAIGNARYLRRHPEWAPLDWAGMLGLASAVTATLLFGVALRGDAAQVFSAGLRNPTLLYWTAFMGIAGAWFASALWNFASRILPPAALGTLLVFEAVFGLAFGFIYDHRLPTLFEGLSAMCLILGSIAGIRALSQLER